MGDSSNFERGHIVGAQLAGASVTKTATLLGVSRATVSKVISAYSYMNHGKTISAKRYSERKSTLSERDYYTLRKIVSKNHTTTAAQVTVELNIYFEDPVSTRTKQHELHISNMHDRAPIAKLLIIDNIVHMCKQWCHDHKTSTSDNCKCMREMAR
jgi:transposase